jgi:DNA-binding transcriptional MerR regulator
MALKQITFDFSDTSSNEEDNKKSKQKRNSAKVTEVVKVKSPRGRKSLKSYNEAEFLQIPDDETLFKKLYYPIGDVANMFKVNTSLIRYWEKEFDILNPKKNAKGDRHFRPEDVKNLQLIYHLLRERKYTIEGAKDFLKSHKRAAEKFAMIQSLEKLKSFLLELRASL